MNKGIILVVFLLLILMNTPNSLFNAQKVKGNATTIYIRADGSIDPSTANITSSDNVTYIFTDNNYYPMVIERDNVTLDGDGFTLQALSGTGIDISERSNVTIKNLKIERCGQQASYANGIYLDHSFDNVIFNVSIINTRGTAIGLSYSSGNRIHHNFLKNNGIHLYQTTNNTIYNNTFVKSIIELKGDRDRVYYNNLTEGEINIYGEYNHVHENFVTKNRMEGIYVGGNFNNVTANNITECEYGILLRGHHGNLLRENKMVGNTINFGLLNEGETEEYNDVDTSNTVDGKPIYFWNNIKDAAVPLDAGAVILRECANITVRDLDLERNLQGVLLISCHNCTILNNTITENGDSAYPLSGGIKLLWSSNIAISGNNITNNNEAGVELVESCINTISGNLLLKNKVIGIDILESNYTVVSGNNFLNNVRGIRIFSLAYYSTISGNNILGPGIYGIELSATLTNVTDNNIVYYSHGIDIYGKFNKIVGNNLMENYGTGVYISYAENNTFYHNNFVDNAKHVGWEYYSAGYANFWDNDYPNGGNYWSGYEDRYPNATEIDNSGIWDTPYVITDANIDNYPLMAPTKPITRKFAAYGNIKVEICSNSSISDFQFNPDFKQISFNVTGPTGTVGFCNLSIPDNLLWGDFSLYMDGFLLVENVDYTQTHNGTHFIFHITYIHSSHKFEVKGTEVVPELSHFMTLTLLMVTALIVVLAKKKSFRK